MDNTEKLLRAFIKAQGYEIEETVTYDLFHTGIGNPEIIDKIEIIDYKVTKKQQSPFSWMDTNSPEWSAIVEYVTDHDEDIEIGINDFATLRPVLNFFNRNSKPFTLEDIKHEFGESIL